MSNAVILNNLAPRINHSLDALINRFCQRYQSEHTSRSYQTYLDAFINWLAVNGVPFEVVRPLIIEAFLDDLVQGGRSRATANLSLSVIKSFYDWLVDNELAPKNPADSVKRLKNNKDKTQDPVFTNEEAIKMIDAPNYASLKGNRDRIVLIMLFHLGLRRDEIINLKFDSIEKNRSEEVYLRVTGKGDKTRLLPLTGFVHQELIDYRVRYERITGNSLVNSDYLLQGSTRVQKEASEGGLVWRIVKGYAKLIGITRNVGPHACRSTVISHLFEKGISARDIANFAGHKSIETTLSYDKERKGLMDSAAHQVDFGKKA